MEQAAQGKRSGDRDAVVREIECRVTIPPNLEPAEIANAVLCVLAQRIAARGDEAGPDAVEALPPGLRSLVHACPVHAGAAGEVFGLDTFLERIATHLRVGTHDSTLLAKAVFRAVRSRLPQEDVTAVEAQLPNDLQNLGRGAPIIASR
jgi:uncharacterized protein (DUF2267 family)